MKITRRQLKRIIKEELRSLSEGNPATEEGSEVVGDGSWQALAIGPGAIELKLIDSSNSEVIRTVILKDGETEHSDWDEFFKSLHRTET